MRVNVTDKKEPETPEEAMDAVFKEAIHGMGYLFNTRAFWIPGLIAGFLGLILSWVLYPGEAPMRLLVGMVAFWVLWVGVGITSSLLSKKKK